MSKLTYFGDSLEYAINNVSSERIPIIENFLYEKSALLLYADDGVGKSIITLQMCLQMTVGGSKLFGEFEIPTPRKVIYFQLERDKDESFERIKHLRSVVPFDKDNFCLSIALQGLDLQDSDMKSQAIEIVKSVVKESGIIPDVIAFDPIYALVSDDLAGAKSCNAVTSFFRVIQRDIPSSILATSHTNRGVRDIENPGKRVGKDMYGNRFLSAFFTGSYQIESKQDGVGSKFKLDKNSQKNLEKRFGLNYDASNYCSWIDSDGNLTKKDRLDNFIKTCEMNKKEFCFEDMQAISELSDSALRGHLSGYLKDKLKISRKLGKGKLLYRI